MDYDAELAPEGRDSPKCMGIETQRRRAGKGKGLLKLEKAVQILICNRRKASNGSACKADHRCLLLLCPRHPHGLLQHPNRPLPHMQRTPASSPKLRYIIASVMQVSKT